MMLAIIAPICRPTVLSLRASWKYKKVVSPFDWKVTRKGKPAGWRDFEKGNATAIKHRAFRVEDRMHSVSITREQDPMGDIMLLLGLVIPLLWPFVLLGLCSGWEIKIRSCLS